MNEPWPRKCHFLFLLIGLIGLACEASARDDTQDRRQEDLNAKTQFRELHFSRKGAGMHLAPGAWESAQSLIRLLGKKWFSDRTGINHSNDGRLEGIFETHYKGMKIGVLGCVACHSGRAAGETIIGLGNKRIDPWQIGKDAARAQSILKAVTFLKRKSDEHQRIERSAISFAKYLSSNELGNLSQGLVPVSFVRGWFYRMAGEEIPEDLPRGQVKVPALWGYGPKREVGQFCDGFGDGEKIGWAVAVELAAGQTPNVVRAYENEVEEAEELFNHFLPPPYPSRYSIHPQRAQEGKALFERTCATCHGTYENDSEGLPIYKAPRFVSIQVVQTDSDRIDGNTPEFEDLVTRSPLSDLIRFHPNRRGYFAPRLDGIWSRFPYLHNASVPNIRSLLTSPEERPKHFSLEEIGEAERFDPIDLGLKLRTRAPSRRKRSTYDTSRVGHSNQGHDFYTDLPDSQKDAIIEYLKTL